MEELRARPRLTGASREQRYTRILHDRIRSQLACHDSRPSLSCCARRCGSAASVRSNSASTIASHSAEQQPKPSSGENGGPVQSMGHEKKAAAGWSTGRSRRANRRAALPCPQWVIERCKAGRHSTMRSGLVRDCNLEFEEAEHLASPLANRGGRFPAAPRIPPSETWIDYGLSSSAALPVSKSTGTETWS